MNVQTDMARLGTWITLPPGARAARWVVRTLGVADSDVPGPTDTVLSAFVQIDEAAWPKVDRALGPPGPVAELRLEARVADALFPPTSPGGGPTVIHGPAYDVSSSARMPYRGKLALRYKDGLLFEMMTQ